MEQTATQSIPLKTTCLYCGNNPVPHALNRASDIITMVNRPLASLSNSWLGRLTEDLLMQLAPTLVRLFSLLHIVTFNTDPSKASTGRSQVVWEEAQRRGIPMRQLKVFGRLIDFYEAEVHGKKIFFESIPVPVSKKTKALEWMDDKSKLKVRLQSAGVPVAAGGRFTRFEPLRRAFADLRKPVIIKPALGSRGRHTTTFIYTEDQLREAFDIAKQLSYAVVMEEHLIGSVYRGTTVDGKIIGVLRGDPPRITGDGSKTIAELIVAKNEKRDPRIKPYKVTSLTHTFLGRNQYALDTVLPAGVTIDLTEKIGISYGGFSAEEFDICHPKIKTVLEQAAEAVDFPVIGFDFIITDITKDPDAQIWGIIEANSLPFIDLHHHPIAGTPINAAKYIWDWWV